MSFPVSISFPPPPDSHPLPPLNARKSFRERPKGLWKGRVTPNQPHVPDRKEKSHKPPRPISDTDDDEQILTPPPSLAHCSRPRKKRRTDPPPICTDDLSDLDIDVDSTDAFTSGSHPTDGESLVYPAGAEIYYWDFSRQQCDGRFTKTTTVQPNKPRPKRPVDTSSTAQRGAWYLAPSMDSKERAACDLDDWEDLKDLFARAAEHYEGNDTAEALPLLRGVIHECHRFLATWPDPSIMFTDQVPSETPSSEVGSSKTHSQASKTDGTRVNDQRCSCFIELPTAFHALLGTALFLFGNVVAQDSSLVLEGEPTTPLPYWLAALDVFETGENLPTRTRGGQLPNLPEDWRMAIVWGRTLVCLAEDLVNRQLQAKQEGRDPSEVSLDIEEPQWPEESPFYAIAAQRQPVTRRMSFNTATPNDLLILAMDQFSRGIFHMPHPQDVNRHSPILIPFSPTAVHSLPTVSILTVPSHAASSRQQSLDISSTPLFALASRGECSYSPSPFSRARQLYTISVEVFRVAEKLEAASERQYWANWADSVLRQMRMEAHDGDDRARAITSPDTEGDDAWRLGVFRLRAQCRLVVGSAYAEEIEAALESGQMDVLRSEEADEAREDLVLAIELFERSKAAEKDRSRRNQEESLVGSSNSSDAGSDLENIGVLLTEALVTLANLTEDPKERDALYARAKVEAGSDMDLDLDLDPDADDDDDVPMD